jgi:hypothetical protein
MQVSCHLRGNVSLRYDSHVHTQAIAIKELRMPTFADVQAILEAIAANAIGDVDGGGCPHKRFWNVGRQQFLTGEVPNIVLGGTTYHIPIINSGQPLESAFFKVLLGPLPVTQGASQATVKQMPDGGPFITDRDYTANVNGVDKTGVQIQADLSDWLTHGMP